MPDLKEKGIALLSSTSVDMKTAASTTLYTVPVGKVCYISRIVVRDYTASLAGGTDYDFTNYRQTVNLSAHTTANTGYASIDPTDNTEYVETAAGVAIQITVNTGSTSACTATIDLFGYLV